jgi:hypothetical protein
MSFSTACLRRQEFEQAAHILCDLEGSMYQAQQLADLAALKGYETDQTEQHDLQVHFVASSAFVLQAFSTTSKLANFCKDACPC